MWYNYMGDIMEDKISDFLDYITKQKKYSENTSKNYEIDILEFKEYLNRESINYLDVDYDFIKGYFKDTQKWININANLDDFDFDYEAITMGDYYYLDLKESGYNNYNLYFYDVENHVLYYIHSNI